MEIPEWFRVESSEESDGGSKSPSSWIDETIATTTTTTTPSSFHSPFTSSLSVNSPDHVITQITHETEETIGEIESSSRQILDSRSTILYSMQLDHKE